MEERYDRKTWLLQYLSEHGYWLRRESFSAWSKKLLLMDIAINEHYLRDIRVWIPDLEGGTVKVEEVDVSCKKTKKEVPRCYPFCPRCKSSANVVFTVNAFITSHLVRKIIALNTHYYLMSRQYLCCTCETDNAEATKQGKGTI